MYHGDAGYGDARVRLYELQEHLGAQASQEVVDVCAQERVGHDPRRVAPQDGLERRNVSLPCLCIKPHTHTRRPTHPIYISALISMWTHSSHSHHTTRLHSHRYTSHSTLWMVCGVCGVCSMCGVWCVVCGVWCVVCGVWCVVCGVWCVVNSSPPPPKKKKQIHTFYWLYRHTSLTLTTLSTLHTTHTHPTLHFIFIHLMFTLCTHTLHTLYTHYTLHCALHSTHPTSLVHTHYTLHSHPSTHTTYTLRTHMRQQKPNDIWPTTPPNVNDSPICVCVSSLHQTYHTRSRASSEPRCPGGWRTRVLPGYQKGSLQSCSAYLTTQDICKIKNKK